MDKISRRRFQFYKRQSSTVVTTTGRESSLSTVPVTVTPNFLDPVEVPNGSVAPWRSTSAASKICATLRLFRQRIASSVPCIDRFLSPRRRSQSVGHRGTVRQDSLSTVRYRRPKSLRQMQLARPQATVAQSHDGESSIEEELIGKTAKVSPALDMNRNLERKIRRPIGDQHLLDRLGPPFRSRSRKMYTPDGKVVHYVVPCHSDSSLSDVHKSNHKMTQVNSESLINVQAAANKTDKRQSQGDQNQSRDTVTRAVKVNLPNAVDSDDEAISSPPSPHVKRVTFWDDLDVFNGNVIESSVDAKETASNFKASNEDAKKDEAMNLDFLFKEDYAAENAHDADDTFEDHLPPLFRSRPKSARRKPVSVSPPRQLRSASPSTSRSSRRSSLSRVPPPSQPIRNEQTKQDSFSQPPQPRKPHSAAAELWYSDDRGGAWEQRRLKTVRRPSAIPAPSSGNGPRKDVKRDLHLKYGRFPKVLQMKTVKLGEVHRPSTAGSTVAKKTRISNSFSNISFPDRYRLEKFRTSHNGRQTEKQLRAPYEMHKRFRSQKRQINNQSASTVPEREEFPARGELKRFSHPAEGVLWNDKSALSKRLGSAIGSDNWSLANQLLYGYLIGSEHVTAGTARPSTAH